MRRLGIPIALALLLAPLSEPLSQSRATQPARVSELREFVGSCERFGFSGAVLVARGGQVLLADGFGLADRARGLKNSSETLFEIASATKPFSAVAILQLEARGKLSLDDPIHVHLPGVPEDKRDITIHHLLTHTSGMPRSAAGGRGDDLEAAVRGYLAAARTRAAGASHEYWNGGYALLAGIVERVSGGSYTDWCRRNIFQPAGMKGSGFTGDALPADRLAVGHEGAQAPRTATEHPYGSHGWHYRGMGGVVTNAVDFYRFERALRDDTLLPAKARARLFEPFRGSYACGFSVLDKPRRRIGHGGDVRGFHTQFRYPDDDACIVILCNVGDIPTWAIAENLQAILFGDASRYPKPPPVAAELAALSGSYEASPDERIVVRVEGQGLRLLGEGGESSRLLSTSRFGEPGPADPELVRAAQRIVAGVAEGDVNPLRDRMREGIPEDWPDRAQASIWPAHIAKWGKLRRVVVAGAISERGTTTVLLALEHESGRARLKIVFVGDRLQIFDLAGPEALSTCLAVPSTEDQLVRFVWQGRQPQPVAVLRDAAGSVAGLRLRDTVYKRLDK